jgi:hypothetical protein
MGIRIERTRTVTATMESDAAPTDVDGTMVEAFVVADAPFLVGGAHAFVRAPPSRRQTSTVGPTRSTVTRITPKTPRCRG